MDILEMQYRKYGITPLPDDTVEAMAYVPFQKTDQIMYSPEQGLERGTMYPVLDKPWEPGGMKNV